MLRSGSYPLLASSLLLLLGATSGVVGNLFPEPIPDGVIPRKADPFSGTINAFFALVPVPRSLINSTVPTNFVLESPSKHFKPQDFGPYAPELPDNETYALVQLGRAINTGWANIHASLKTFREVKVTLPWAMKMGKEENTLVGLRLAHWTNSKRQKKRIPHSVHAPVDYGFISATETSYSLSSQDAAGIATANFTAEPISSTVTSDGHPITLPPVLMSAIQTEVLGMAALNKEIYRFSTPTSIQTVQANVTLSTKLWNRFEVDSTNITLPVTGFKASLDWTMHHTLYEWDD
ncbi:hypothetical protein BJ684DRAFT_19164 [Piptocephalis cylindrospora]|uniref:Uncharacterized protein n=1 Tax=Piptocephalis cylindrospora TaxID=1907219 RepID=A0A4P9Y5V7_9FUNG|nr:hypothetical protein BJ684DRAFT_19164 [Piptocephalis cylindrospora]|eukprot:RKP14426.1 hypothetical protein BJ684DRAFT_19164 [Piptocephalis cylindrospora]